MHTAAMLSNGIVDMAAGCIANILQIITGRRKRLNVYKYTQQESQILRLVTIDISPVIVSKHIIVLLIHSRNICCFFL